MTKPKVSVIVPVYNVEDYISRAITSILDQSYTNFELLIVDDGSTDSSIDICKFFDDERIRIITQKNRGLAGARNTGIRESTGEYLAFLDSDDIWHPRKLDNHVAHLDACSRVGVSYAKSELIDECDRPIGVLQSPKLDNVEPSDVFLRNPIGNGSVPVIRRTVLNEIQFSGSNGYSEWFDESFRQSEDIECWMRIALTTKWNFAGIDETLTYYRVNEGGLSANIISQFESWERVASKVRDLDQKFHKKWYRLARAFQLRYLARRAARMRNGQAALSLVLKAINAECGILFREPKKTIETLGAAILLRALPVKIYEQIESKLLAQRTVSNA